MIDNELPVLRKEDLITILELLFKFSQEPNNALEKKQDGLYVKDFYDSFNDHINNTGIHPTSEEVQIIKNFSLVNDVLYYKNKPIAITVSSEEGNAIEGKEDGLYVKDLSGDLQQHTENTEIHITEEERNTWNGLLEALKTYVNNAIDNLNIYDYQFVSKLPTDRNNIKPKTFYFLEKTIEDTNEKYYVKYTYKENKWIKLDIIDSYGAFALKESVSGFITNDDNRLHSHDNKSVLDLITLDQETGRILFGGIDVLDVLQVSKDPGNAITIGSDGKLYAKDLTSEVESIVKQDSSMSKTILLDQDCDEAGTYELEDDYNDYNFLMIYYYLLPDIPNAEPCDAKMELLDVDGINDLYDKNIDYIIEHDYGISTYNSKIRFHDSKMQITYYNNVCIYKIIGVK